MTNVNDRRASDQKTRRVILEGEFQRNSWFHIFFISTLDKLFEFVAKLNLRKFSSWRHSLVHTHTHTFTHIQTLKFPRFYIRKQTNKQKNTLKHKTLRVTIISIASRSAMIDNQERLLRREMKHFSDYPLAFSEFSRKKIVLPGMSNSRLRFCHVYKYYYSLAQFCANVCLRLQHNSFLW